MITIGYLAPDSSRLTDEESAAWQWLSAQKDFRTSRITFADIAANPAILQGYDALWWHTDSALVLPSAALTPAVREALLSFMHSGRGILLSLLAAPFVVNLGLESVPPNVLRRGTWGETSWAEGYPDIRGFGSYQGHPMFDGLGGGVYTWNPVADTPFAGAYYEAPAVPRDGRVIAVERQYIRLNEHRRVVCEYTAGRGNLITVGAFLYFAEQQARFRLHLGQFVRNTLRYLAVSREPATAPAPSQATWWDFSGRSVEVTHRTSIPLEIPTLTLPDAACGLSISRESHESRDEPFDIGGRRILVMGKERTGVQEIWCHPFRLLRNLRLCVQIGSTEPKRLEDLEPQVTVRPESLTRIYVLGELRLEETLFTSPDKPCGSVHYAVHANHPLRLLITCSIDLRLMWPHSEHATGSLDAAWDDGLTAAVVRNTSGTLTAIIGASRAPDRQMIGRFSGFTLAGDALRPQPTDAVEAGVAMLFDIGERHTELCLGFAGSDEGEEHAVRTYRALMKHPGREYQRQVDHFRKLLEDSTMMSAPDPAFNEGYRWALVGTNRFMAETPKLGTSLMAGFGTTERGWNGGHAVSGRPGYAWYFGRDAVWTAFAMLGYGDLAGVRSVLEFLGKHQDLSGKILHELTSSGHTHYDAADSTPLYVILMGRYLQASGDREFVRREFPRLRKAMEFCTSTDTDGDGLIENTNVGHGWVEGGRLFPVHTELYLAACWGAALEKAAFLAEALGDPRASGEWSGGAAIVRKRMEEFWNKEQSFYNFAKRADGSFRSERTVLAAAAAALGMTDRDRTRTFTQAYASSDFSADWGVRMLGRSSPGYNPRAYHAGSVWPLFTGWASLAEFVALRPVQGFLHAASNLMLYRLWAAGFIEEVLHGDQLKQAGVCSHQAWSESMVLQPILEGMMGLNVDALKKTVSLRPYLPPQWDHCVLGNVRMGEERLSWSMERQGGIVRHAFQLSGGEKILIRFQPLLPLGTRVHEIRVDGELRNAGMLVARLDDCPVIEFDSSGRRVVTIRTAGGIALVPPMPEFTVNQDSHGVRILGEDLRDGEYVLALETRAGEEYCLQVFDQDAMVTAVEGARMGDREGRLLSFTVDGGGGRGEEYVHRQVRFRLRE